MIETETDRLGCGNLAREEYIKTAEISIFILGRVCREATSLMMRVYAVALTMRA